MPRAPSEQEEPWYFRFPARGFLGAFRILNVLEGWRKDSPARYFFVRFFFVVLAVYIFFLHFNPWLAANGLVLSSGLLAGIFRGVVSALAGFVFVLLFQQALPFLYYAPHALAMRAMGLVSASIEPGNVQSQLATYAALHPKDARVKVICISGRYLFRESREVKKDPVLQGWAKKGLIDAIMPFASEENPTVSARYSTYSEEWLAAHCQNGMADFLAEIEQGQTFLEKMNSPEKNTVHRHDMLCMWRIVLFRDHCVVQNYFPNHDHSDSDVAPTFVFKRGEGTDESYYACFEQMFDLIAATIERRAKASRSNGSNLQPGNDPTSSI